MVVTSGLRKQTAVVSMDAVVLFNLDCAILRKTNKGYVWKMVSTIFTMLT